MNKTEKNNEYIENYNYEYFHTFLINHKNFSAYINEENFDNYLSKYTTKNKNTTNSENKEHFNIIFQLAKAVSDNKVIELIGQLLTNEAHL